MPDQEKRPLRGINIRILELEQDIEGYTDTKVVDLVRGLNPSTRRFIKHVEEHAKEFRVGKIDFLANVTLDTEAEEQVATDFLSLMSMKPEILDRLAKAVNIVEAFEGGASDTGNRA